MYLLGAGHQRPVLQACTPEHESTCMFGNRPQRQRLGSMPIRCLSLRSVVTAGCSITRIAGGDCCTGQERCRRQGPPLAPAACLLGPRRGRSPDWSRWCTQGAASSAACAAPEAGLPGLPAGVHAQLCGLTGRMSMVLSQRVMHLTRLDSGRRERPGLTSADATAWVQQATSGKRRVPAALLKSLIRSFTLCCDRVHFCQHVLCLLCHLRACGG